MWASIASQQMFSGPTIIYDYLLSIKPHLSALRRISINPSVNSVECSKGRDVTPVLGRSERHKSPH